MDPKILIPNNNPLVPIDYSIEDNFLPLNDFHAILDIILSRKFEWNVYTDDIDEDLVFFSHYIYRNYGFQSKFHDAIKPLMEILKPHSIVQIRANLYNRTIGEVKEFEVEHKYKFKHKILLYMINDNDGYVKLPCGTKVESKQNRAILLETDQPYIESSCTDDVFRATIQFHYF